MPVLLNEQIILLLFLMYMSYQNTNIGVACGLNASLCRLRVLSPHQSLRQVTLSDKCGIMRVSPGKVAHFLATVCYCRNKGTSVRIKRTQHTDEQLTPVPQIIPIFQVSLKV